MSSAGEGTTRRDNRRRIVTVAVVVLVLVSAHLWYGNRHNFLDLRIYWEAVRWWAHGHNLYDYARPDPVEGSLPFTYPPFAALLMLPLAWTPYLAAVAVFSLVNLVAIGLTTWWLVAPVARRHDQPRWYLVALAVPLVTALEPIRETVTFGQVNLVLAALVVGDLLVAVPRGSRLAGVGVGLAAAIKLTPAIFIVYLLITRRWRAAATAVGTAAAATLLAAAVAPHASWRFFTQAMWDPHRVGHLDRITNQSILGALARLAAPVEPNRAVWLVLGVLAAGYGLVRAARAAAAGDELSGVTLTGIAGSLLSPVTWDHHLYWFVPALVVLVDAATSGARHRRALIGFAIAVYLTVTVAPIQWFDWGLDPRYQHGIAGFFIDNWFLLLMIVLLVALPVRAAPREETGDETVTAMDARRYTKIANE
ncbi:MAG TPA: glycosyltransferase 87 family protein [Micromonosporaceae bacterium]